jgi:hypothetical protein
MKPYEHGLTEGIPPPWIIEEEKRRKREEEERRRREEERPRIYPPGQDPYEMPPEDPGKKPGDGDKRGAEIIPLDPNDESLRL